MKMKAMFAEIVDMLASVAGLVGAVVLYTVIGLALAVPYTYLTGGVTPDSLFFGTWILPLVVGLLFCSYQTSKAKYLDVGMRKWLRVFFYSLLSYSFFLPVVVNGSAAALKWAGYKKAGEIVFECRYLSLIIVPIIALVGLFAVSIAKGYYRRKSNNNTLPPLDTPPSDSSGSSGDRVISTRRGPSEDMSQMICV